MDASTRARSASKLFLCTVPVAPVIPMLRGRADGIAAEYKSAKAACAPLSGTRKDGSRGKIKRQICEAEAKGKRDVARAELEARYSPSNENRHAVNVAKVKADYAVAKKKCEEADHVKYRDGIERRGGQPARQRDLHSFDV